MNEVGDVIKVERKTVGIPYMGMREARDAAVKISRKRTAAS